jgi:hypothetical protein
MQITVWPQGVIYVNRFMHLPVRLHHDMSGEAGAGSRLRRQCTQQPGSESAQF